jgi:hypothetical protein
MRGALRCGPEHRHHLRVRRPVVGLPHMHRREDPRHHDPDDASGDRSSVLHRCPKLPRSHVVRRADGIRVVNAARVCFDEAKHRDALGLESLIEDAINRGRTTVQRLYDMGREMCKQGRAGSARFADVLESRPAWALRS